MSITKAGILISNSSAGKVCQMIYLLHILIKTADAIAPFYTDAYAVQSISGWQIENWACTESLYFLKVPMDDKWSECRELQ